MINTLSLVVALCTAGAGNPPAGHEFGVTQRIYDIGHPMGRLPTLVEGQTPNVDRVEPGIDWTNPSDFGGLTDFFVVEVLGALLIEEGGVYGIAMESDDGSRLWINGSVVIDHDGIHPTLRKETEIELQAGLHPLRIDYFENDGQQSLRLLWRTPASQTWETVPPAALVTKAGLTPVTSPGPKRLMGAAGAMRPGSGMPLEGVHPSFAVNTIRPEGFEPQVSAMSLAGDGTLYLATFSPNQDGWRDGVRTKPDGVVWAIDNPRAAPHDIVVRKVAEGLFEPAGLCVVDGVVYVSQRNEITRLRDDDGDGWFEKHDPVARGWISDNYHHFTFGLVERDGSLYAALSTSIFIDSAEAHKFGYVGLNGPNPRNRGTLLKVDLATRQIEYIAGGFRTPNGLGIGPRGQILVSDNQGAWKPTSCIYAIEPGAFYGHYNATAKGTLYPTGGFAGPFESKPVSPPALWLPHGEVSNSPTNMVVIPDGPFAGQMYLGELTAGGIRRVLLEEVEGVTQGAVFRFTQGLECGVNRLVVDDDGTIYIGGTGAGGNWNWRGTTFGLQRLTPTGSLAFEIAAIRAVAGGFHIEFTKPVHGEQLTDASRYFIEQYRYEPSPEYGGPKLDVERLSVEHMIQSTDSKSAWLTIPGLKEGHVVHVVANITSNEGDELWSNEAWYTLNKQPAPTQRDRLAVLVYSRTAGFRHGSIGPGIEALRKLGFQHGFDTVSTENPAMFTDGSLAAFDVVVFLNTTGDVLDDEQQAAFERFIQRGGGFVGIHSASDTEYDWPWYGRLVGAYFAGHPPTQPAVVEVHDHEHCSTRHLPERWGRNDEWYNFQKAPEHVNVLATLDTSTYTGSAHAGNHPIAWYHEMDGGRAFYTAGGHTNESFSEPEFLQHLLGGILWAARRECQTGATLP